MAGHYDNETGKYLMVEEFFNGHWFEDDEGMLYIVPDSDDDIDGPDTPLLDRLNAAYFDEGIEAVDPYGVAEKLGMSFIEPVLRRFSEDSGYYHA